MLTVFNFTVGFVVSMALFIVIDDLFWGSIAVATVAILGAGVDAYVQRSR